MTRADGTSYDATPCLPGPRAGLPGLRGAATECHGCPLYRDATRTVFEAGDAGACVTNAVKHFKFTAQPGRKRRIHKAPSLRETTACLHLSAVLRADDREAVYGALVARLIGS